MQGLIFAILLVVVGAWGWNKYGSDITTIWNASKSVTTKSADEISKAKEKIGKALKIFDNLKFDKEEKSTSTNHRITQKQVRICHICKKPIKVGVWGEDNICAKCWHKNR